VVFGLKMNCKINSEMYIPPSKMDTPTKKAIVDGIFIRKKLNFISSDIRKKLNFISSENANPSRIQENVLIKMFFIVYFLFCNSSK